MKVNEAIFREYDIRGIVGRDLSVDFSRVFGAAYGTYLAKKGVREALVGFDARETSPNYYKACCQGLISAGIDVISVGMVTSPMIYWARKYYKINGAVAVTASHNPPEYNGFKPCIGNGAMFGQGLQEIKKLMMSEEFTQGQGKITEKNIKSEYVADVLSRVKLAKPLEVIVDCANATGCVVAPELIEKLGTKVTKLFCELDPEFPNHPPDPVDPAAYPAIVAMVKKGRGKYDCGLVFDGDADRLGIVDELGNIVRGDLIAALCARKILSEKKGSLIEFELQCSKSATDDVVAHGGRYKLIRVGHSFIEESMLRDGAEMAGETSGHIFFNDRWYGFDDAVYAACRFLEYASESGKTVSQLVSSMPKYISTPQTRVDAPDDRKFGIINELEEYFQEQQKYSSSERSESRSSRQARTINDFEILTIDGVRLEWPDGWAVVRASNTQPQLTLRAEAKTKKRLDEIKKLMEEALKPYESEGIKLVWGKI